MTPCMLASRLATCALLCASLAASPQTARAAPDRKLTDSDVLGAVERELFSHAEVPQDDIDVAVQSGIVTLTGTVDSLLERERARRLSQAVRGVRAVVDRIDVAPRSSKSDVQLKQDLEQALTFDPVADGYEVDVAVDAGVARLRGQVDSYAERMLAERVARGVRGLRKVQNELVVRPWSPRADGEIAADVRGRLYWDEYVDARELKVSVQNGVVTLEGRVGSDAERERAFRDAWVMGARGVETKQLTVDPSLRSERPRGPRPKLQDADIERAVEAALKYDPRVRSFAVEPQVKDGVVTLAGVVSNLEAKRAAADDARGTTGVSRVIDRIRVRGGPVVDDQIASNIRAAIERDPYVERFEILVSVDGGAATLTGTVDSWFEKMRAEQIASRGRGVSRVKNRLTVFDDRSPWVYEPRVGVGYPYDYPWYGPDTDAGESDDELRRDIEDELFWSPFLDGERIEVSVQDGVATLKGKVDSRAERRAATTNALQGGAHRVENELRIDGWDTP